MLSAVACDEGAVAALDDHPVAGAKGSTVVAQLRWKIAFEEGEEDGSRPVEWPRPLHDELDDLGIQSSVGQPLLEMFTDLREEAKRATC
jgi:hypothetical protein